MFNVVFSNSTYLFTKADKPQGGRLTSSAISFKQLMIFFSLPTFLCELLLQSCAFDCRWLLMPDCDGALFVSWMCNLPSSCLWLPTEKGLLVLCLPRQSHWLLPSPSPLCTLTYSCPTGCSERDRHPWASEGRRALLLLSQIQLTGSSHSRWAVEIKPPGTWQPLWRFLLWNLKVAYRVMAELVRWAPPPTHELSWWRCCCSRFLTSSGIVGFIEVKDKNT